MNEEEILDNLKMICRCKAIRKKVFLKHLQAGASTVAALQKATGAGTGSCKGKECIPRIVELLHERKQRK
ncbi:MAG TPA: (2Fe-2S)-binding protein [Nitrospirota bacterium]|nr:(2Fe-2S)-binding protein [Nitrospirota bacterium]